MKPREAADARATNNRTALLSPTASGPASRDGTSSVGTVHTTSPARPSGSRLVASTRKPGAAASSRSVRSATSATTCSQLSSTSNREPMTAASRSTTVSAGPAISRTSIAACRASSSELLTDRASGVTAASSTKTTPSEKRSATSAAAARANRVLPTPPGPVSVTSREDARHESTSAKASSRPMSSVSWAGRFERRLGSSCVRIDCCNATSSGLGSRPSSSASSRRSSS